MATPREIVGLARSRVAGIVRALRDRVPTEMQGAPTRWGGYRTTQTTGVVKGLTPTRIATMLREADQGYPARFCELMEEIEDRDPHILSVLATRKRAVANLGWAVKPSDDRRQPRRVAEFVRARLMAIDNLEDGFLDLLDAIPKGYAAVELDWYNRAGEAGVRRLLHRPQRWFRPDPDDPELWRILDEKDATDGILLQPYRFAVHVSRAKSGFPVSAGLGRVLTWWYLFKNVAVKDWANYAELFGAPLRIGKYPAGTKPADIDALEDAVDQLGVDASAVIQNDMQIEFVGDRSARSGADVYERLVTLCDRGVSKAVLGQTLTTEEGQNGTRALGQVHDEVRRDLMVADAKQLARTVMRDIVRPLVYFNFGPDVALPTFAFDTEPPADEKARAEAQQVRAEVFKRARDLGIAVPVAQVTLELDIRQPAGDEPVLGGTDSQNPPAAEVPARPTTAGRDAGCCVVAFADREVPLPPHLAQVEATAQDYLQGGGSAAWRKLVTQIQDELGRARTTEELPARFVELAGQLDLTELQGALADAVFTGELIGRVQAATGDRPVTDMPQLPPREAAEFWTTKGVLTPGEFYGREQGARAAAFTISRFTALSALAEAKEHLDRVIRDGGTLADFEDGLEGVYQRAGMGPLSPWRLQTVFDTNVFTAYGVGRWEQMTRPDALARRGLFRYHTMRDAKVRPAHRAMEGQLFPADHPIWDVWAPPNGYACRCYLTAHSADEARAMGWIVGASLPNDPDTGGPLVPDLGFQRNPAKTPITFDWSRFSPEWRRAIGVGEAA